MNRNRFLERIHDAYTIAPICAILGPRQCGKTTLSQQYSAQFKGQTHVFDLEHPLDLARLENPWLTLEGLKGVIIIDEIQRRPDLFPVLRVLVDKDKDKKFLILGSASQDLIRQSSETLAGRISYIEMTPFSLTEVINADLLWKRGGFPLSFLAKDYITSNKWRKNFIQTFLEKDIPAMGFMLSPQKIRKFWMMLIHYHGNIFNASEIGRSLAVTHKTSQQYLEVLDGTFMVRVLHPWFENISKRQVKSPKIFFRDSGIFHTMLGIDKEEQLITHPKLGASWEGFALEEITRYYCADPQDCYFWATQGGAELDLLVVKDGRKIGFEFKYTDHPKLTKSMLIALNDLELESLYVITPLQSHFPLHKKIFACDLQTFLSQKL